MYKLCIVGLGNPGTKYNNTRHNIGKDWILSLSKNQRIDFRNKAKFEAEIGESLSGDILWVVPSNYVNNSGKTVSKIMKSTNLEPKNFLIIHDELDLEVGNIKLKNSGGHGGHNGIRDIINRIGTEKFYRLRVGIGHPGSKDEVTDWVLNKFTPKEKIQLEKPYLKFVDVFELIKSNKISEAQKFLHTE